MKVILVLGAGRSSSVLISYLLQEAGENAWQIVVGDFSAEAARERVGNNAVGSALHFDVNDERSSRLAISQADVVISLLPPHLHITVARYCIELERHLITASYVSQEMRTLDEEAKRKKLLFLNECGLDPGIDHMSVMQVLDKIRTRGGKIRSVESFTGGLLAPETDRENPWRYKFTWNPRNVVLAGQGVAKFLKDDLYKYIPYQQLFSRTTPISVEGLGAFEGYANRDSLSYLNTYNLQGIKTMLRGTLREKGYCSAWNIFVQLGCCDDSYTMTNVAEMTHLDFVNSFLDNNSLSAQAKIAKQCDLQLEGPELQKLTWSGFFTDEPIGLTSGTPAQILEHILNKKWRLSSSDKDLIVMWHRFTYEVDSVMKEIQASLIVKGDNAVHTGMAKTVGLPLGIAASLLLKGKISLRGVVIPVQPEIYNPVLEELKKHNVIFVEKEIS